MACHACHSRCGDCSESGITFKRVLRPPTPGIQPTARVVPKPVQVPLVAGHQTTVQAAQEAQK